MSQVYIRRLRAINDDLEIAREFSEFIRASWHRQDISGAFPSRSLVRVQEAEDRLDITYFVRLTAEFEGILKDHLRTNHPRIDFPDNRRDWTVDWFVRRVIQQENVAVSPDLRRQLDDIRNYRNAIAHGNAVIDQIAFREALRRYSIFVARLPEPLR